MNLYPLVSICIATFNSTDHLTSTLKSIEDQDYPNIEVSICDDASNDSTFSSLENWRRQTSLPVILSRNYSNEGPGFTFARAVNQSEGAYLVMFSHDDQMGPRHVSQLVAEIQSDPSLAVVPARRLGSIAEQHLPSSATPVRAWSFFLELLTMNFVFTPGTLVARQFWDPSDLGVVNFACQDWEMFLNLSLQGGFGRPSGSIHYVIHGTNLHLTHGELAGQLDAGLMFRRVLGGERLNAMLQTMPPRVQQLLMHQSRSAFLLGTVGSPLSRALNIDIVGNSTRLLQKLPNCNDYSWAAERILQDYGDGSTWTVQTRSVMLEEIGERFSESRNIEKGSFRAPVNGPTKNGTSTFDTGGPGLRSAVRKMINLRRRRLLTTRILRGPRALFLKISRRLALRQVDTYPWYAHITQSKHHRN